MSNHMGYRVIYIGVRRGGIPDSKSSPPRPYGGEGFYFFEYYNVFGTIWLTQLEHGAIFIHQNEKEEARPRKNLCTTEHGIKNKTEEKEGEEA